MITRNYRPRKRHAYSGAPPKTYVRPSAISPEMTLIVELWFFLFFFFFYPRLVDETAAACAFFEKTNKTEGTEPFAGARHPEENANVRVPRAREFRRRRRTIDATACTPKILGTRSRDTVRPSRPTRACACGEHAFRGPWKNVDNGPVRLRSFVNIFPFKEPSLKSRTERSARVPTALRAIRSDGPDAGRQYNYRATGAATRSRRCCYVAVTTRSVLVVWSRAFCARGRTREGVKKTKKKQKKIRWSHATEFPVSERGN